MIEQVFVECKKKRDWRVAKIAEKNDISAVQMSAVEVLDRPVRPTVLLAIRSATGNILGGDLLVAIGRRLRCVQVCTPLLSKLFPPPC